MSDFEFVCRHSISDNAYFHFEIDEYKREGQQFLLVHMQFREPFTKTAMKRALYEWSWFRKCVPAPLYAVRNDGDLKKWTHFVTLFGFKPTNIDMTCNNDVVRPLFISTVTDVVQQKHYRYQFIDDAVGTASQPNPECVRSS